MQRLQGEDREDAGHQVEKNAAGDRAEYGEKYDLPVRCIERRAAFRHSARDCLELQATPICQCDHAGECLRRLLQLEIGNDPIARALERLRRLIIDHLVGDREQVGLADLDACR
jgi:hypothetical protein